MRRPTLPCPPVPLSTLLVLASVTGKLADWVTTVVGDLGLKGIFLLMTLESMCIPIPSEPTMLFAGFNVDKGTYSFIAVVTVAVAANVLGSWIAYGVGRFGRIELIERHGKWLHIKPSHIEWADRSVSRSTATPPCSSAACCRSSARSSRCRRASRGCRSGASRCSPCSAASRGWSR